MDKTLQVDLQDPNSTKLDIFQVKTCRLISQCLNRIFEKLTLSYRKIPRVNRPDLYFLERFMRALTNALLIKTENLFWTKRE